jgi:hypothetical protein
LNQTSGGSQAEPDLQDACWSQVSIATRSKQLPQVAQAGILLRQLTLMQQVQPRHHSGMFDRPHIGLFDRFIPAGPDDTGHFITQANGATELMISLGTCLADACDLICCTMCARLEGVVELLSTVDHTRSVPRGANRIQRSSRRAARPGNFRNSFRDSGDRRGVPEEDRH